MYLSEQEKSLKKKRDQIIAKGNDLIYKARDSFSLRELRILLTLISKIKPTDTGKTEYAISVKEIGNLCSCEQNYSQIKKIVTKMLGKVVWLRSPNDKEEEIALTWFARAVYNNHHGILRFMFNDELHPYLFGLKEKYTSYPLSFILPMRSQYSIKLYELLRCFKGINPNYEYISFSLNDLKRQLGAETYTRWVDFKRKVLEPALGILNKTSRADEHLEGEINYYTDLRVFYRVEKLGRSIEKVVFHIMQKPKDEIDAIMAVNGDILSGCILDYKELQARMLPENTDTTIAGQYSLENLMDEEELIP